MLRIGIDLLGSETEAAIIFEGILGASKQGLSFVLYGSGEAKEACPPNEFEWVLAEQEITMEDHPLHSIRQKKKSSMVLGVEDLRDRKIDAFISTGNTGAMIALAALKLTRIKGVDRPFLLASLPTEKGFTSIVDVGGSSLLKKEHLISSALLGVEYLKTKREIARPRVALLNIGTESLKGTPEHQFVYNYLKEKQGDYAFIGNIEGKEVFSGNVDLVVTDGFTGNIFLKTAEGASHFLITELHKELNEEEAKRFSPLFTRFSNKFSQNAYPGAAVLGIEETLIKCHGQTTALTITQAILDL